MEIELAWSTKEYVLLKDAVGEIGHGWNRMMIARRLSECLRRMAIHDGYVFQSCERTPESILPLIDGVLEGHSPHAKLQAVLNMSCKDYERLLYHVRKFRVSYDKDDDEAEEDILPQDIPWMTFEQWLIREGVAPDLRRRSMKAIETLDVKAYERKYDSIILFRDSDVDELIDAVEAIVYDDEFNALASHYHRRMQRALRMYLSYLKSLSHNA